MNLQSLLSGFGGRNAVAKKRPDTAETVYVSSLALLKMLKHGRAGIPLEVMGLMLGKFVDAYTVVVDDVFAMPQQATGQSVTDVDPVFQKEMTDLLNRIGRKENVVGWYHSHPGFGPFLSHLDQMTQGAMEKLESRSVAVVVDPIQSVRGKVVIDAFRVIGDPTNPFSSISSELPRETTSNIGHLKKPNMAALIRGLNKNYYSLNIENRKTEEDINMFLSLDNTKRTSSLNVEHYQDFQPNLLNNARDLIKMTQDFKDMIDKRCEEEELKPYKPKIGKIDPKRHLRSNTDEQIVKELNQTIGAFLNATLF
ncbi:hypothetical protein PCE1_000876 [Barthelona sp. PCE]